MPDDLMRAKHADFGVADVPDNDFYRDNGWTEVDESTPTAQEAASAEEAQRFAAVTQFDPSSHTVERVREYLAGDITDGERVRVLDAERAGQARKSLLEP